jgi:hypothetical protein
MKHCTCLSWIENHIEADNIQGMKYCPWCGLMLLFKDNVSSYNCDPYCSRCNGFHNITDSCDLSNLRSNNV